MGIAEMLAEVKTHFEHGVELAASHVEPLIEWAAKFENDPLVQTAISLAVGPETKTMLAGFLKSVEAEVQRVEADAAAKAAAAAVPAPEPVPADPAAPPA